MLMLQDTLRGEPLVPSLVEALTELGVLTKILHELDDQLDARDQENITPVSTAIKAAVEAFSKEFEGYSTLCNGVHSYHASVKACAVHQHNSTTGTETLVQELTARVPGIAAQILRAVCRATTCKTSILADTPLLTAAITEHLANYAAENISPADIGEIQVFMLSSVSKRKYTHPTMCLQTAQWTQDTAKWVQEPAAYFVSGAIVATYHYVKSGTFQQWCESNVQIKELYFRDYCDLLTRRAHLGDLIRGYQGVIQSLQQMLVYTSSVSNEDTNTVVAITATQQPSVTTSEHTDAIVEISATQQP
eukprot:5839-Heterococcus_DN1.PRE.5